MLVNHKSMFNEVKFYKYPNELREAISDIELWLKFRYKLSKYNKF